MKKIVLQDFVHHLNLQPIEIIGQWHVFEGDAIPKNWPSETTQLAMEADDAQLQYLRDNAVQVPVVPRDFPEEPVKEDLMGLLTNDPQEIVMNPETGETQPNP